jgi:hypothetical protein
MGGDHRVDDREPEPGRGGVGGVRAGRVGPGEPLEQVGKQLGGDAGAVVGDRDHQPGRGRERSVRGRPGPAARLAVGQGVADPDGDRGAVRGVPPGVGEQVGEHLPQPVLVAEGEFGLVGQFEHPAVAGAGHLGVAGGVDGQPGHVDGLAVQRPPGVEPGEQQQVVDEDAHPGGLGQDSLQGVRHPFRRVAGVPQGQFRVAADGREGGAQLVAGVRGEAAQPVLARRAAAQRGFHVPEHPVEREPYLARLGARVGVRNPGGQRHLAGFEGQLRDLRRGRGHPAQRAQREPDPEGAGHPGEQQDRAEHGGLGERDVAERAVQGGQRQAGDVDGAVAVRVADRGELERALRPAQVARRSWKGQAAYPVRRRRGLRWDAEQGVLVYLGQLDRVLADEVAVPVSLREDGDERPLAEPGALVQAGRHRARLCGGRGGGSGGRGALAGRLGVVLLRVDLAVPAVVGQPGGGLQLAVQLARQRALHGEVGDKADRGAGDGEQRDEPGDQPAAQGTGERGTAARRLNGHRSGD